MFTVHSEVNFNGSVFLSMCGSSEGMFACVVPTPTSHVLECCQDPSTEHDPVASKSRLLFSPFQVSTESGVLASFGWVQLKPGTDRSCNAIFTK